VSGLGRRGCRGAHKRKWFSTRGRVPSHARRQRGRQRGFSARRAHAGRDAHSRAPTQQQREPRHRVAPGGGGQACYDSGATLREGASSVNLEGSAGAHLHVDLGRGTALEPRAYVPGLADRRPAARRLVPRRATEG
jgi:hypothetical protein